MAAAIVIGRAAVNHKRHWRLPAPAKLNLMLHITGQRPDGYHTLQTLFQLIDFGDELELRATSAAQPSIHLTHSLDHVPTDDNLITRAANCLMPFVSSPHAVSITLHKRIPMGGGLGGGSSNAATTLLALNQIWQCGLDTAELAKIGLSLGADVPLFVRCHSAWATGLGEQLTPVKLAPSWFVVCHPNIHVSTADVFADPDLTRNSQETTIQHAVEGHGHNDCEPVVRRNYPEIAAMLDTLKTFGTARLTGTGACGFVFARDQEDATQIAQSLQPHYPSFIARGINVSPLQQHLHQLINTQSKTDYPK